MSADGRAAESRSRLNSRRAKKACHSCHARKVRCDVTRRGGEPCSNCVEDGVQCTIRERINKRAIPQSPSNGAESTQLLPPLLLDTPLQTTEVHQNGPPEDAIASGSVAFAIPQQQFNGTDDVSPNNFDWDSPLDVDLNGLVGLEGVFNTATANLTSNPWNIWPGPSQAPEVVDGNSSMSAVSDIASPLSVSNNLNLIDVSNQVVSNVMDDKQFLISQGCFQLPPSPVLKQLMMGYFQFVHPNVPIINEAEFWNLWDGDSFNLGSFSVLVIQAMCFAAVAFTSAEIIQRCGFSNGRKARILLYRKAKLLFDFAMESDPTFMAQGALLLTYYAPRINKHRVNSSWLMNAIRYARIAGADKFYELEPSSKKQRILKRLWWCCILRDRILPLGVRRAPQIEECPPDNLHHRYLEATDFEDELGSSLVHDQAVQTTIIELVQLNCMLAEALTPALKVLYSTEGLNERFRVATEDLLKATNDTKSCIEKLNSWNIDATSAFPSPINLGDTHETINVFANLLFIYYDAAILALCSHVMLMWETASPDIEIPSYYDEIEPEIVGVISDTTTRTKELVQCGLARYLPISCSAFLTFPMFLHALNMTAASGTDSEASRRRELDIYTKAMILQQNLYDGTDFCYDLIANITAYAEKERFTWPSDPSSRGLSEDRANRSKNPSRKSSGGAPIAAAPVASKRLEGMMSWEDLLHKKPRLFLRVAAHFDFAFCAGAPPQEEDFPEQIRISELKKYRGR